MRYLVYDRRLACALSVAAGGGARLFYARWAVSDFWGDAYHHWLISRLTLANGWAYTDYKGLETLWLPGYHYLISALMVVLGRFDLTPAHLTNVILGALACGLTALLVADITRDWRAGLGAGLGLAFLPWHIAYSYINMPEVMAGVLLLLALLAAQHAHAGRLAGLVFVSVLTRYELAFLLALVGSWLGWRRQWRATLGVALGLTWGLGLWSFWSWRVDGEPLSWWTRYQVATAWDASFWTEAGVRLTSLDTLWETLRRAFPPLAVLGPLVVAGSLHRRWRSRVPPGGWLLMALVGSHWLVLGLGFVAGHLPSADPRYVMITLPLLAGVGSAAIVAIPRRPLRLMALGLCAALLALALVRQLADFRGMAYVIEPERAAGEYLGAVAPPEGNFWVDAPTTIYYSGLQPDRFFSSDRLLPAKTRGLESTPATALAAIVAHDIRFVLWEDVPYTFVTHVWPQMAAGQAFEQDGHCFEPMFYYSGWELDYGARATVIWQVHPCSATIHDISHNLCYY